VGGRSRCLARGGGGGWGGGGKAFVSCRYLIEFPFNSPGAVVLYFWVCVVWWSIFVFFVLRGLSRAGFIYCLFCFLVIDRFFIVGEEGEAGQTKKGPPPGGVQKKDREEKRKNQTPRIWRGGGGEERKK